MTQDVRPKFSIQKMTPMKLTYISHASLLMEQDALTVVTDPWFNGSAYFNQWHVFPKPADTSFVNKVTHILLTHGHEDHLHIPTLMLMDKRAKIYFPYTWHGGTRERLLALGFTQVEEVNAFKTIKLTDNFSFTFIVNGLDAFVIYEYDGQVVVNLNDALNAHHWSFVEIFTEMLRKRWKTIDLLICGLGGASYFPNTVHAPMKNDREIALLREQFLTDKFCEIMEVIKPIKVMAFVPGFALLERDKMWINEVKFSRNYLPDYYKNYYDKASTIAFICPLPGDFIEQNTWHKSSPYHLEAINDNLAHLVSRQYAAEIAEINQPVVTDKRVVFDLERKLNRILPVSRSGIAEELLAQVNFVVQFLDVEETIFIHCFYADGKLASTVSDQIPAEANLKITTHTAKFDYAVTNLWGGDVFFIGYGADIYVLDEACLADNIDIVSIRLLSRFPAASNVMLREPFRAFRYLSVNTAFAKIAVKQKWQTRGNPNKLPFNERAHWVNKSKCDVCRLCDIPLLSDELGEMLAK